MAQKPIAIDNNQIQKNIHEELKEKLDKTNAEQQQVPGENKTTDTVEYRLDDNTDPQQPALQAANENSAPTKAETHLAEKDDRYRSDPQKSTVQSKDKNEDPQNNPDTSTSDSPVAKPNSQRTRRTPACFVLDSSWTSLKLTTTVDGEEECTDVSAMSPVKIQFMMQYWSKQVQDALKKREIELNLEKSSWEEIHLEDKSTNKKSSSDLINEAINVLEESLDQVVIRSCSISEEAQTQMLPSTISTPEIVANKVSIYKQGIKGICVVGFKEDVVKTYELVQLLVKNDSPCTRQIRINSFDAGLLRKLDFIGYVEEECGIKIGISSDTKNPIILMHNVTVNGVHQIVENIELFRNSLVWMEYNVAPGKLELLKLHETRKSIEKIFEIEKLLCYVDIPDESESVFIYTRTEEDGKTVAMLIKTGIQKITVRSSFVMTEKFSLILKRFQGKILVRHSDKSNTCRICCTNDALAEISVAVMNLERKTNARIEWKESDKQQKTSQTNLDAKSKSDILLEEKSECFVSVPIRQREFDILMYFWGHDYMKTHKDITINYSDQQVVVRCDQPKSENLKNEINNERDKICKMTDTEIPIENDKLENAESCLQTLQREFQQIYFFLDKDNFILHAIGDYDYGQKQQITHTIKILTGQIKGTKRGRRFAAGEDVAVVQNDRQSEQDNYKSLPGSLLSHDSFRSFTRHQAGSTDEKRKFVTKDGIDIYVYSQIILRLDVDCIVNSANERLGHGAGVAAVIANAAGYELEREGRDYIRQHGEIPVGECCHTTAGKLPYKYVIHTVGPRWSNSMTSDEQKQRKKELKNAVESCFYEADKLGMRSIGVPSVSAGIFGMPPYICAKQYREAVINYSQQRTRKNKSTTLKEIHFIDMNVDMCRQIADVFSKCGELQEAGLPIGSKTLNIPTNSLHSYSSHVSSLSKGSNDRTVDEFMSNSEEIVCRPCGWITIHLLQSSITYVKGVSVVVSPENLGFKHQGRISRDILAKADEEFRARVEITKDKPTAMKSVFILDCTKGMPWKHVVYAIAPRWSSEYAQKNQQFEIDLRDTMMNIVDWVQMKGAKSLAVPLLGTAISGIQTPIDRCCRAMLDGIWSIINKGTRAKKWKLDLWIVTTDPAAIHTFKKMLDTRTGSTKQGSRK